MAFVREAFMSGPCLGSATEKNNELDYEKDPTINTGPISNHANETSACSMLASVNGWTL